MFICHKCGYKDTSEKDVTYCPVCGTNITFPKFKVFLFLFFILLFISIFLTIFSKIFHIITKILIFLIIIFIPLAIGETIERESEHKKREGFRTPNTPNEILKARIPNFKSYDYIYGLDNSEGIKEILIEAHTDGLNIFYKTLSEILTIEYTNIADVVLYHKDKFEFVPTDNIIKYPYVMEIQIKDENLLKSIYISSYKIELDELLKNIKKNRDDA